MKHFFLIISILFYYNGFSQQDAKAVKILDKVAEKTKAFKCVKAEFIFTLENTQEDVKISKFVKQKFKEIHCQKILF